MDLKWEDGTRGLKRFGWLSKPPTQLGGQILRLENVKPGCKTVASAQLRSSITFLGPQIPFFLFRAWFEVRIGFIQAEVQRGVETR